MNHQHRLLFHCLPNLDVDLVSIQILKNLVAVSGFVKNDTDRNAVNKMNEKNKSILDECESSLYILVLCRAQPASFLGEGHTALLTPVN